MQGPAEIWLLAADNFEATLAQVGEEQWTAPTGCGDWTVRDGTIVGTGSQKRLCYLVWKEEDLTDFELTLKYRLPRGGTRSLRSGAHGYANAGYGWFAGH